RDAEPKYGLAVVGTVRPDGIWPKNGARPGDVLFLTKPLGTGLIMTGYKRGEAGTQQLERAIRWMRTLNRDTADVIRPLQPHAVTDVTGFGLFGHAREVAEPAGAGAGGGGRVRRAAAVRAPDRLRRGGERRRRRVIAVG